MQKKTANKKYKKIIVCASGYFDPIHIGHIEYLAMAKTLGDKLVVIVNNDKQSVLKKGFSFMPINDRLKIVKSLKCVDDVFASIDMDLTVCKSIAALKPNIFAKGGNRNTGNIPEKKICDELGIKIVDGLGAKIRSSSELLRKNKKDMIIR